MKNIEHRNFTFNFQGRKMRGHAAVFKTRTNLGWMDETIQPGAFLESIRQDDVRAMFNHNPDLILGRTSSGTLKLSEDDIGLKITIDPPQTYFAHDLAVLIERGDIREMSFAFKVIDEEWRKGVKGQPDLRILKKVRLFDVSPVTFPAYDKTDIAIRTDIARKSHDAWKARTDTNLKRRQLLLRKF